MGEPVFPPEYGISRVCTIAYAHHRSHSLQNNRSEASQTGPDRVGGQDRRAQGIIAAVIEIWLAAPTRKETRRRQPSLARLARGVNFSAAQSALRILPMLIGSLMDKNRKVVRRVEPRSNARQASLQLRSGRHC